MRYRTGRPRDFIVVRALDVEAAAARRLASTSSARGAPLNPRRGSRRPRDQVPLRAAQASRNGSAPCTEGNAMRAGSPSDRRWGWDVALEHDGSVLLEGARRRNG